MKDRFQSIGRIGIAGLAIGGGAVCTTPESEYIKGTVVSVRTENDEYRTEVRREMLSDCPDGTAHLSNACLPKNPYDVTVEVWDAFDNIMTDIIEWSKRVRKGGIVSGHNHKPMRHGDVTTPLNIYVKAHGIPALILMDHKKEADHHVPNWWFVK